MTGRRSGSYTGSGERKGGSLSVYLVTGGAGFIGSHLVRFLLDRDERVRVLDDFSTGKRENLSDIEERIELQTGSLSSDRDVERAVEGVDYILHQAAIPSVPRSVEFPLESHESNATGTLRLLRHSAGAGVRRLVYASSSSVYGANPTLPKVESMATEPMSPYAVAKLAGEHYVSVFHRLYGLETVSLRYFNVFGPRQDPGSTYSGVVSRFIDAIASKNPPAIQGTGEQTRDFTYVENVARANFAATREPAAAGGVYNIGCSVRVSVNDLWRQMAELSGSAVAPRYVESRPGDVPHSLADIGRARRDLGYEPSVDLREGLRRTLSFYGILSDRYAR